MQCLAKKPGTPHRLEGGGARKKPGTPHRLGGGVPGKNPAPPIVWGGVPGKNPAPPTHKIPRFQFEFVRISREKSQNLSLVEHVSNLRQILFDVVTKVPLRVFLDCILDEKRLFGSQRLFIELNIDNSCKKFTTMKRK